MKSLSGRDFARLVERRGWRLIGREGSVVRLSIPIHGSKTMKTGLLRHLAKAAEVPDEDLG